MAAQRSAKHVTIAPERWAQMEELFHRAVDCDPQQRTVLLDEACRHDPELRQKVEALLAADGSAGGYVHGAVHSELGAFGFPLAGENVSHYRILEGLGGGGMGLVYRAEDIKLERQVAIKFLPEESTNDPTSLARFQLEARSASALEHPNICSIYEFGEHEGQPFLVMQLLEGQTLRELLAASDTEPAHFTLSTLLDLVIQILDGLEAAHSKGIIHRDIKPANIFVTKQGQAKILDFGLAKLTKSVAAAVEDAKAGEVLGTNRLLETPDLLLSRTGVAVGTVGYMSPEQVRGEKVDSRTDLFSFGLVFYEMATGKRAFNGDSVPELHHAILHEVPATPRRVNPAVSAKLERVISKALEKERNNRYQSATEIRDDLRTLRREIEPRGLSWWAVASSVILVFMAIASLWFFKKQSQSRTITPEIKVRQLTVNSADNRVINGVISPNGKYLAYVDLKGMHLQIVDTGASRAIPLPDELRNHKVEFECITWSPDSIHFLCNAHPGRADRFGVTEKDRVSIWQFSVQGGKPRMLRDMAIACCFSPDGSQIAFGTNTTREIWVMDANGGNAHKVLVSGDDKSIFAQAWSADSQRLVYSREKWNTLFNVLSRDLKNGTAVEVETDFWKSEETENVLLLPDGRNLFGRIEPGAILHSCNFWLARNDLRTGKLIEQPRRLTNWNGSCMNPTSTTADGKKIVYRQYLGHPTVYIADLQSSGSRISSLRHFTLTDTADIPCDWTPDSKTLIFRSFRGGHDAIYRQLLNQDSPQLLVTDQRSGWCEVSPDGKWIIYFRGRKSGKPSERDRVMRMPIGGGTPQTVFSLRDSVVGAHCSRFPSELCVVLDRAAEDPAEVIATAFDPMKGLGAELTRIKLDANIEHPGVYLSPDGTRLAVLGASNHLKIFTIGGELISQIQVKGSTGLINSAWAPDGKALFVSSHVPGGYALLRVTLDGQTQPLIENHSPDVLGEVLSPDGRHLALTGADDSANLWMMENF